MIVSTSPREKVVSHKHRQPETASPCEVLSASETCFGGRPSKITALKVTTRETRRSARTWLKMGSNHHKVPVLVTRKNKLLEGGVTLVGTGDSACDVGEKTAQARHRGSASQRRVMARFRTR